MLICSYSENAGERDLGRSHEGEDGEVSQEARCDWVATTSRGSTCSTDSHILQHITKWRKMSASHYRCGVSCLDLLPEELLAVVETSEILVLPQQLNGWLRAVCVQLGHV